MSKKKALLTAGIIGLSPIANANEIGTEVENTTNKNLTEVLDTSNQEKIDNKNVSREEAQKIAKDSATKELIKHQINSNIDDLDDLIKHYGKEVVRNKLSDMIETISANSDEYGSFDEKGNFQLNEEKIAPLIKETFKEAIGNIVISKWEYYGNIIDIVLLTMLSAYFIIQRMKDKNNK